MGYELLEKPLTADEIKATDIMCDVDGTFYHIDVVVPVSLTQVIDHDLEGFNDILEYSTIGDLGILGDINYDVVGSGLNDELHIRVTGFVELTEDIYSE